MKLAEIIEELDFAVRAGSDHLDAEITVGYSSDLMSDVIAHGRKGGLWITLQIHQNIVAVAVMKDLAGIVLVNGREPEADTVEKAESEGVPLMVTPLPAFEVAGRLHGLGVRGVPE